MTGGLHVVAQLALGGAALYFAARILRRPRNAALWAIELVLLLQLFGYVLQDWGYLAAADQLDAGGIAKISENAVLMTKNAALAAFFLLSAGGAVARRRARWEIVPLLGAVAGISLAMYATPHPLRDHSFASAPMQVPGISGFYLIAGAYFIYITALGACWAWSAARESDWRLGLGLRVAALGVAILCGASIARAGFVIVRAAGGAVPPELNRVAVVALMTAQPVIVTGLVAAAVLTSLARLRLWRIQRYQWQQLRPLWTTLHGLYPEDALSRRQLSPSQERRTGWRIKRRWWRRWVEIRDGLVQLSPWLFAAGWADELDADQRAGIVLAAVELRRAGGPAPTAATVLVAAPTGDDLASDINQLVELSQAIARHPAPEADHAAAQR